MNNLISFSPSVPLTFHRVGSTPYCWIRKPSCAGCLAGRSLHWLRTRVRREFQNTVAHSHLHIREGRATPSEGRFHGCAATKITIFWHETAHGHVSFAPNVQHNPQTHIHSLSSVRRKMSAQRVHWCVQRSNVRPCGF